MLILIAAGYQNSLKNPFHYDDFSTIVNNKGIKSLSNIKYIFNKRQYFALFAERTYRPLTSLIYSVNWRLFGDNAGLWRIFNLAIHLLNCWLLFLIFRRFKVDDRLAFLAVCLFAVHTVHTENFNVISFNEDLIGGLFCLTAFYLYFQKSAVSFWLTLVFYYLGCSVKETFVVLPALCLLFEWHFRGAQFSWKRTLFRQGALFLVALFFLFVNFHLMTDPDSFMKPIYPGGSIGSALLTFVVAISYYLKLFILPTGLRPVYQFVTYNSLTWPVGLSLTVLGLIIALLLFGFYRRAGYAPYLTWFLLFLLPTSNLIPYGGILAERYLYLPFMGLTMGVLLLLRLVFRRIGGEKTLVPLGLAFLVFLSVLTIKRNAVYKTPQTLWRDVLSKNQNDYITLANLADSLRDQQDYDQALFFYRLAIQADPMWPLPYSNLARIYQRNQQYRLARENFEKALERRKGFFAPESYFATLLDLGALHFNNLHNYEAALKYWVKAKNIQPDDPGVYYNLSLVYRKLGQKRKARAARQRYQELKSSFSSP